MAAESSHDPPTQVTLETFMFSGMAALILLWTCTVLWHLRWVRRLPPLESLASGSPSNGQTIRCSIVVAARDEQARIEQTVGRLLAQRGVELELIVVDDRSTDRTPEILKKLASADGRVRMTRVDELPEGWLGKCHACHLGASAATGEWILFTDADCWLKPDVIERAVRLAERDQVDHVTLAPGTVLESQAARAWHLGFLISLVNWFSGVNRDRPKSYLGLGAFNLVRAAAYRECGGYGALRLTIVDDVKLGLLLRRAGKRTRAFLGVDDVLCHWGGTLWSMIKIMEKNYFAALDFRLWLVVVGSMAVMLFSAAVLLGLMSGTAEGLAAAFSPLTLVLPGAILARRLRWSWVCAFLVPFILPVFLYSLLNSTFVTLRQGGIRWRDTFYPLDALRSANVQ